MRCLCLLLVFLGSLTPPSWGRPALEWQASEAPVTFQQKETEPLRKALRRFLNQYAVHPTHVVLHPNLPRRSALTEIKGTSPAAAFRLLLARNDLLLLHQQDLDHLLPRRQVWKVLPVRQVLEQPTPLREVLQNLARKGWIPLTIQGLPEGAMVEASLDFPSVENAFQVLAEQYGAELTYHPQTHHLIWTPRSKWHTAVMPLGSPEVGAQVQALLQAPELQAAVNALQVSFLRPELLLLQGPAPELETVQAVIEAEEAVSNSTPLVSGTGIARPQAQTLVLEALPEAVFRQHLESWTQQPEAQLEWQPQPLPQGGWSVTLTGPPDEVEAASASLMRLENERVLDAPPEDRLQVRRFELKFLQVHDHQVQSSGEALSVPGAQSLLEQFLQHRFQQNPVAPEPEVLADPVGNALIVQGAPETLQEVDALLQAWDQPHAQIQIEAHIFETTKQDSQRLGVEFASLQAGASSGELFALGATLEGQGLVGSRVDALLRVLEEEGRGRVLSRPVIVTTNNVEAEVNSGSRINVKLYENRSLQELQTGVTLRVTPRVVSAGPEDVPLVALTVRAETSTPSNTQVIDGIPVINTQRAESEVTVPSGRPFLLSGLIKSSSQRSVAGVPLLRDLPLLGVLFQSQGQEQRFDHVVVIVTPRVLSDPEPLAIPNFPGAQQPIQQP